MRTPAPDIMAPRGPEASRMLFGGRFPDFSRSSKWGEILPRAKYLDYLSHVFLLFPPNKNIKKILEALRERGRGRGRWTERERERERLSTGREAERSVRGRLREPSSPARLV